MTSTGNPAVDAALRDFSDSSEGWLMHVTLRHEEHAVRCALLDHGVGYLKVQIWGAQHGPVEGVDSTYLATSDIVAVTIEQ